MAEAVAASWGSVVTKKVTINQAYSLSFRILVGREATDNSSPSDIKCGVRRITLDKFCSP